MTICFLNHDLKSSTGAGRFGRNLIGRIEATNSHPRVIVLTTSGSGDPREFPILFKNWFWLLLALPRIRRIFRDADIIHALDGYPYGVLAVLASLGLGKKIIITAIGTGAIQPLSDWRRPLMRWAYRKAHQVVAISNYTKREIMKYIPDLSIMVVNHAVDVLDFDRPTSSDMEDKIAPLKPYILSVGGWKRRKGFEYSFAAFAEILKQHPGLHYVVCGIGPKPKLEDEFGLHNRVSYFKGIPWPFLVSLYHNAELFILLPVDDNKDVEGFGFAFLEAAASGLPVVGTLESGAEDSVSPGENGFLVAPRDPHAAAEAALTILDDASLRSRFREGSFAFAKRMNWENVIEHYRKIYRELLGDDLRIP